MSFEDEQNRTLEDAASQEWMEQDPIYRQFLDGLTEEADKKADEDGFINFRGDV